MNIALTGGIASGKSSVSRYLGKTCGAQVFDADRICFELLLKDRPGWNSLHEKWGDLFLDEKGEVNRITLRRAVFSDKKIRHDLENILHPLVRREILHLCQKSARSGKLLLFEIPLLFEVCWQGDFDWVITVYAERQQRLLRICKRDNVSFEEADKILAAQMDMEFKIQGADSVIDNSGLWVNTCLQVHHLAHFLLGSDEKLVCGRGGGGKNP